MRDNHKLKMVANRNIHRTEICRKSFSGQLKLIGEVFDSGPPITSAPEDFSLESTGPDNVMGWVGSFPISLKSKVRGVIFIDQRTTGFHLSEDESAILGIICNQAAVALENMEVLARKLDPLEVVPSVFTTIAATISFFLSPSTSIRVKSAMNLAMSRV